MGTMGSLNHDLVDAVITGDAPLVQNLLERGADPNSLHTSDGVTAVHMAAKWNRPDCLLHLLASGGDPNVKSLHGYTPVHEAAFAKHRLCLESLLDNGGDVNLETVTGNTPLHLAVASISEKSAMEPWSRRHRNIKTCIQSILSRGANPNALNSIHLSPLCILMSCTDTGKYERAKLLLDAGAVINTRGDFYPLEYAVRRNCLRSAKLLLDAGARPGHIVSGNAAISVFELAVQEKCTSHVLLFLKAGPVPANAQDGIILRLAMEIKRPVCLLALLEAGVNPNDRRGSDPAIFHAIHLRKKNYLQHLLAAKADPNILDGAGATPLHCCLSEEFLEGVPYLLNAGANPNIPNRTGESAMCYAINHGQFSVAIEFLRKGGGDPTRLSSINVFSLFEYAAFEYNYPMMLTLLNSSLDLNSTNVDGRTALYTAATLVDSWPTRMLLSWGADPFHRDNKGVTVVQHVENASSAAYMTDSSWFPSLVLITRFTSWTEHRRRFQDVMDQLVLLPSFTRVSSEGATEIWFPGGIIYQERLEHFAALCESRSQIDCAPPTLEPLPAPPAKRHHLLKVVLGTQLIGKMFRKRDQALLDLGMLVIFPEESL